MLFDIKAASSYLLPDLVDLLNRGFENYFVPIKLNFDSFLTMLRKDGIDLSVSRVLFVGEHPMGIALIARRGWASRLAAMGISQEMRGKGAGSWMIEKLILEARQRHDREMVLEVIEANDPAVRLYKKQGFQTVRRLIGLSRKDAEENGFDKLHEIDLREMGRLLSRYALPDLPWQLSAESIAQMNPPARAYGKDETYAVISNPDEEHIVVWSLLVEPAARGRGLGVKMLKTLVATHAGKTWHVPALLPEELGKVFERAGFERENLSQLQMRLDL